MAYNSIIRFIAILLLVGVLGFSAVTPAGCGAAAVPVSGNNLLDPGGSDGGFDGDALTPDVDAVGNDLVDSTIIEDDPFARARALDVGPGESGYLIEELGSPTDLHVYDIGSIQSGERLIISVDPEGELDPVLGIFDADGDSMMVNDDRNYYGGDFSAGVSILARHATASCYVAVAVSSGSGSRGEYTLEITRGHVETLRAAAPQTVYLNFDGADGIVIGRREPVTMPPFEGSDIGESFVGLTEELIEATVAEIRADYDGLDVEFISSRDDDAPAGPHTTIHFGAYDPGLLGIADYVDEFNAAPTQKAIVYVDTFRAFLAMSPSLEEMAVALANVASHETGHLLGLNHTVDPRDIMDTSASLRQMLADQVFGRSPLHREVFPIGYQDNARLLVEAVGGDLAKVKANAAAVLNLRASWYDEGESEPARRLERPFSTCFCETCVKQRHVSGEL